MRVVVTGHSKLSCLGLGYGNKLVRCEIHTRENTEDGLVFQIAIFCCVNFDDGQILDMDCPVSTNSKL